MSVVRYSRVDVVDVMDPLVVSVLEIVEDPAVVDIVELPVVRVLGMVEDPD